MNQSATLSVSSRSSCCNEDCHSSPSRRSYTNHGASLKLIDDTEEEDDEIIGGSVSSDKETLPLPPTTVLPTEREQQPLTKLQKRTSFTQSRKHAVSVDHSCRDPSHHSGSTTSWLSGGSSIGEATSLTTMHSHSGSDSGLEMGSIRPCRRSANELPHLRVLHDSLLGLTNRLTSSTSQGSQESLPDPSTWDTLKINRVDRTKRRRSKQDAKERLTEVLKQCDVCMPKPDNPEMEQLNLNLESSWDKVISIKDIKEGNRILKQQAAIWELLHTELNILRHLKTIIEVYVVVIKHVQATSSLLTDVDSERLFLRVEDVFRAHLTLWDNCLRLVLVQARQTGDAILPRHFLDGFRDFSSTFKPCIYYCLGNIDSRDYLKQLEKHELFTDFLKWAQKASAKNYNQHDGMVDLKLDSLLTMPAQRIMKYGLLLQEILKYTELSDDRIALQEMIQNVNDFCRQLDESVKKKSDMEEIRAVIHRLDEVKPSDWLDSPTEETVSVVDQYKLNLMQPMSHNGASRRKVFDGDLKLKDEKGKWFDVKCFLFTDLFLVTRYSKKNNTDSRLRVLKHPVRLDKLVTHKLNEPNAFLVIVLTDFMSVQSVFILYASDFRTAEEWMEKICKMRTQLSLQMRPLTVQDPSGSSVPMRWLSDSGAVQDVPSRETRRLRAHTVELHPVHSANDVTALVNNNSSSFNKSRVETSSDVYTPRSPPYLESRQSSVFFRDAETNHSNSDLSVTTQGGSLPTYHSHNVSVPSTVNSTLQSGSNLRYRLHKSNSDSKHNSQDSEDDPGGPNSIDSGIPDLELSPERRRLLKLLNDTRASQV